MSMEDPFFVVRDEVQKALVTARSLFSRWREVQEDPALVSREEAEYTTNELRKQSIDEVQKALVTARSLFSRWREVQEDPALVSREEAEYTTNELRNSLRSIEWDLEDLEETVSIVEKNQKKFKIDDFELNDRRNFIERTRASIKDMKSQISSPGSRSMNGSHDGNVRQALLPSNSKPSRSQPQDRYTRLDTEMERANQNYVDDTMQQQQLLIQSQDDQLDMIGSSVGVLKNMSSHIGNELEDQNAMLDEFRHDMDHTETRLDQTMKKMAKVMHMSNDKRQWCAILVLIIVLIIVLILFFLL